MDQSRINNIIDKYWLGETTLEEEAILRAYFNGDAIEAKDLPFKAYFDFLRSEQSIQLDKEISIPEETAKPSAKIIKLRPMRRWFGVAASIFVVIGFFWILNLQDNKGTQMDTYENPELALEQAKEALFFLSNKMDKGAKSTTEQIKQLEKLSIFN